MRSFSAQQVAERPDFHRDQLWSKWGDSSRLGRTVSRREGERPQGDLNPCYQSESLVSWT
jgi:hypothetical protein